MVTSRAVVGSSAMSNSGLQDIAIAIITRCLIPPDIWCGYSVTALAGVGDTDFLQHFSGKLPCLVLIFFLMKPDCLDNLLADGINGIQAGHRLLENHRDAISANGTHSLFRQFKQISAIEIYFACDDFARRVGYKTHNGQRGNAFAAAAFTDEAQMSRPF